MDWKKSRAVAQLLGVSYWTLQNLMRDGRFAPPAKDESGDYIWFDADVERARAALANQRRRNAVAAGEGAR